MNRLIALDPPVVVAFTGYRPEVDAPEMSITGVWATRGTATEWRDALGAPKAAARVGRVVRLVVEIKAGTFDVLVHDWRGNGPCVAVVLGPIEIRPPTSDEGESRGWVTVERSSRSPR